MKRSSVVWLIAVVILAAVFVQSSSLIYKGFFQPEVTARATDASFSICINHEPTFPVINVSCNTTIVQNNYYSCDLNISDYDGDALNITFQNYSGNLLVNISDSGVITSQPNASMAGDTLLVFSVHDDSGCVNNVVSRQSWFSVIDVNDPPVFVPPMGPFEWSLETEYRGIYLGAYFYDPDDDPLTYTYSSVPSGFLVTLTEYDELILSATECGVGTMIFTATDPENLSASSTPVWLNVPCPSDSSGGSGGGSRDICESEWECSEWDVCLENGTQKKECEDLAGCEEDQEFWRECEYVPQCQNGVLDFGELGVDCGGPCPPCKTCFDGIQNQGELGVDCGGPCPICKNCFDGIRNFGELGVDCGGPCPACPTCFDGIQNQNETGVDCGGPCPACKSIEVPGPVQPKDNSMLYMVLGAVGILIALGVLYRLFHQQLQKLLARLLLFLTRRHNKEVLLTEPQRDSLLQDLSYLESRKLLIHHPDKKHRAIFQDELAVILRKLYIFLIGNVVSVHEVDEAIDKLKTTHLVKHILKKHYTQLLVLEQHKHLHVVDIKLHMEMLRQRIFSISKVSREHIAREVSELDESDHDIDAVNGILHNLFLSLQFNNSFIAKKKYMKALTVYESLTLHEQSAVFGPLHLAFDEIRYVSSYSKK